MIKIENLEAVNENLESKTPLEIVRWAHETFGTDKLSMMTSMQRADSALSYILFELGLKDVEIIFIDTQYHFPETLELRDKYIAQYGLNIKTYYPDKTPQGQFEEYGRELYKRDGDYQLCCHLRKEVPFLRAAQPFDAILSAIMRSEGGARKNTPIVQFDPRFNGYKIHPLANWNRQHVDEYNNRNQVLIHPLHDQNYPSIGCLPCTTPVRIGEDERAGRWRHIRESNPELGNKLYCGINYVDQINSKNKESHEISAPVH